MNSKECLYEILGMLNFAQMNVCEKHNYLKVISQDLDRLEQLEKSVEHYEATIKRWGEKYHLLEKQYKQTKSNFKNSQTHSKNCYKKLKEKYKALETAYKNNEGLVRDNVRLMKKNLELHEENQELDNKSKEVYQRNYELIQENTKLKNAIKILKGFEIIITEPSFPIEFEGYDCAIGLKFNGQGVFLHIGKGEAKLLKEVLGDEN